MNPSGFGDELAHKDLYEMAAAYLFHLVQNHPFNDGDNQNQKKYFIAIFFFSQKSLEL